MPTDLSGFLRTNFTTFTTYPSLIHNFFKFVPHTASIEIWIATEATEHKEIFEQNIKNLRESAKSAD